MSDVFISYARSTAAQARAVGDALRAMGYSVWCDDELPSHRSYGDVIEEQLSSAKAVVVVWSAEAVKSHWVRSEADRGLGNDKLVQLTVDRSRLPMPFDQIQCADLSGWTGDAGHPAWLKIVASVIELAGAAPTGASPEPTIRPSPSAVSGSGLHALLLTDIETASLLWLNHRAAMQEAVAGYQAVLRAAVVNHGGEVFRTDGEAMFARFGSPSEAVAASGEAQVALAERSWPGIGSLKARMAIDFGNAYRRGGDLFGPALNRCAKLLMLGHGGQVLVTATAADLLAGGGDGAPALRVLGAHPLDDPSQRVGVRQLLISGLPQDFPPLQLSEAHPNNLPKRPGTLIGRDAEMAQIAAMLGRSGLVTITGAGGVGKTRIAIEVGLGQLADYEDGVWLAELAPISDPEQVPGVVARAMNIDLPAGQDKRTALVDRLRPRRCLVLLDNCEHVIDAVAALVGQVLDTSTGVRVLASSQELLGVEGEQVFRLRSLHEKDAAALFTERALAADAAFKIGKRSEAAVAAICRRLDGIPLAIEMAAARGPSLGCEGVLQRLDDRFRVLTGGRRTALPRQRTLLATLEWSHGLLGPNDAAVFRRLGVFTGDCTLEAVSDVASNEDLDSFEVVDALSSLVAKSLVAADTEDNRTRYRLLETTRAFALEKLEAAGEVEAMRRRHAEHFTRFAAPAFNDYYGPVSDDVFYARYATDIENIDRAIAWAFGPTGDSEIGVALTAASYVIWVARSLYPELVRWAEVAAGKMTPATPLPVRAALLGAQAGAYTLTSPNKAIGVVDQAVEANRASGDLVRFGDALWYKGFSLWATGRSDSARAVSNELVALTADLPVSRLVGQARYLAAILTRGKDGPEATEPLYEKAVEQLRSIGAEGLAIYVLVNGTTNLIPWDNPDVAIEGLRDLLRRLRPTHMLGGLSAALAATRLMELLARRAGSGDLAEAMSVGRNYQKAAGRAVAYRYLLAMALVSQKSGRSPEAARIAGFAAARRAASGAENWRSRHTFEELSALLASVLPSKQLAALQAEGAGMSEDQAFHLVIGEG
jgi:predicted ATPase/class 3 adenylate cyclase